MGAVANAKANPGTLFKACHSLARGTRSFLPLPILPLDCSSLSLMSLIVQKFGGTSVADVEKIQAAARKAIRAQRQGHQVVMVVSAMGKNTDALLGLASAGGGAELDQMRDALL